jgi:hypothetical protein
VSEPWQRVNGAVAVDPRCAREIIAALADAGFAISP